MYLQNCSFSIFFLFFSFSQKLGDWEKICCSCKCADLTSCIYDGVEFAFLEIQCFVWLFNWGCFFSFTSSKSGQSVLPIMLSLLEIYYLCIQYLQINISEAKGLFVSCFYHCCALLTAGWLKLDRNTVMWLLYLCLVCAAVLPGSVLGSSLLLWASGFVIYWLKTAWDLYIHLAVGARKSFHLG